MKKSFKSENPALAFISGQPATNPVQNTFLVHDTQEVQQEPSAPSVQEAAIVHGTQGKKGQKLPRINMAFSLDNLEYLQIISRVSGVSITEYVNRLVMTDRHERAEELEQAKAFLRGVSWK